MSSREDAPVTITSTCDRCRNLKVKCVFLDSSSGDSLDGAEQHDDETRPQSSTGKRKRGACRRCHKAGEDCTFEYSFKKSGRPTGSTKRPTLLSPQRRSSPSLTTRRESDASTHHRSRALSINVDTPSSLSRRQYSSYDDSIPEHPYLSPSLSIPFNPPSHPADRINTSTLPPNHLDDSSSYLRGSMRESIFGSARTALEGAVFGDYDAQPWLSGLFGRDATPDFGQNQADVGAGLSHHHGHGHGHGHVSSTSSAGVANLGMESGGTLSGMAGGGEMRLGDAGPSQGGAMASGSMGPTMQNGSMAAMIHTDYFIDLGGPVPQVEAIGTWSEFCFFFSLFMRHQHALVPLVHKPTFAMDVLNRRDQRDEAFRGLLFSIVTYTICQCPVNMMSKDFSRERLLALLEQCQRLSRLIHVRHSSRPNLVLAASTELDILSSQATNKPDLTSSLFSDAQRHIYSLRLNAKYPPEGTSAIETEIGRRIFWHLYSTDKTQVMNGGHTLIHHQEGLPPLPLEVDDEHLSTIPSTISHYSDPASNSSHPKSTYISGFVSLCKIFVILGECQARHRSWTNDPDMSQDLPTLNRWLERAVDRLRRITESVSAEYKSKRDIASGELGFGEIMSGVNDEEAIKGIQQANICITGLCAEFALLDLRLALRPDEDPRREREMIAKKAYSTLSGIPIEYLASNGEAMRGKVLRTILALFNASTSPQELGDSVWDWWSMYSQVQYVQVIPST